MTKAKTVEINRELAIKVLSVVDKGLCKGLGSPKEGEMCIEAAVNYAMGLPHGDNPPCVGKAVRSLKISLNDRNWSSNTARAAGMRRLSIAQLGTAGQIDDREFIKALAQMTTQKIVPRAFRTAARVSGKIMKVLLEEWAATIEKEPTIENCRKARDSVRKENGYTAYPAAADAADAAADVANAAHIADAVACIAAYAADAADAVAYSADAAAYAAAYAADAADAAADAAVYAVAYSADAATRDKELSFFAEEVVQILITMKAQGTEWLDLTEPA
jgi:hypothetical protein